MLTSTEFKFSLPRGLVDSQGNCHRQGIMRLATAKDEMVRARNCQAQNNSVWSDLLILSQVIIQIGSLAQITPELLENLFTTDLAYLRELYNRLNRQNSADIETQCPHCQQEFNIDLALSGESWATP